MTVDSLLTGTTFTGIPSGSYTLSYIYRGNAFEQSVATDTASNKDDVAYVSLTIDPSKATSTASSDTGSGMSMRRVIGLAFIVLAVASTIIFVVLRVRSQRQTNAYTPYSEGELQPLLPTPTKQQADADSTEGLLYVGQSLKDLVVNSMREEAKRRNGSDKK